MIHMSVSAPKLTYKNTKIEGYFPSFFIITGHPDRIIRNRGYIQISKFLVPFFHVQILETMIGNLKFFIYSEQGLASVTVCKFRYRRRWIMNSLVL